MRLLGFEVTRVKAQQTLSSVPSNYGGGWWGGILESFGGAWQSGVVLDSPRDILSFPGVFAPLTLIASDIAKLRIKLVEEDENGICTEISKDSPFLPVLRKPNRYQTRIKFVEQWIVSKLLYGNTYVLKERDKRGIVSALYVLDAQRVTPLVAEDGGVYYRLSRDDISGLREPIIVPAREIIHDMMVSLWHPLVGVSPNYAAGTAATMGNRIQANSTRFFGNQSRPSGILSTEKAISAETALSVKTQWEANYSGENAGRTAVLGDALKYQAMTIPAEQAQLIEQFEITDKHIAACFHVPQFKVGGPIPIGSSIEALQQVYYTDCLQAYIESAEACLDEGLDLPANYYTVFDLDGLLRMDMAALIRTLAEGVKSSIFAPNEARAKINLGPVKGGESPMGQHQDYSLAALAKRDAREDPFGLATKPAPAANDAAPADNDEAAASLKFAEELRRTLLEVEKEARARTESERASREMIEKATAEREEAARMKREAEEIVAKQNEREDEAVRIADLFVKGLEQQQVA